MPKSDIVEAATAIRPELKTLLGADAETVEQQLDEFLQSGENVDNQILNLLGDYEATGNWINNFLQKKNPPQDDEGSRGFYSSLAGGSSTPITTKKYTCPDEKAGRVFSKCNACDYANGWSRQSNADSIPYCPEFSKPLKLVNL
jgi:hypothetical protein